MSRESIFVFDDGSLESKVLQFELKTSYDITAIKVPEFVDLDQWKQDFEDQVKQLIKEMKTIIKIFLPFSFEDYVTKDIRTVIMEVQRKYPNVRIIPWYEQAPRDSIKHRAMNYGIKDEPIEKGLGIDISEPEKDRLQDLEVKNIASDIIKEADKPYFTEPTKKGRNKKKTKSEYWGNA